MTPPSPTTGTSTPPINNPDPTIVGDITPFLGKWTNDEGGFVVVAPDGTLTATFDEAWQCTATQHTGCDTVVNNKVVSPGGRLTARVTTFQAIRGAQLLEATGTITTSNDPSMVKPGTKFSMSYGWGSVAAGRVLSTSTSGVFTHCSTSGTGCGALHLSDGTQEQTTPAGGAGSGSDGSTAGSPSGGAGSLKVGWSPFIGTWETGDGSSLISITKTGAVTDTYRTYTACSERGHPSACDQTTGHNITPGGHVTGTVTSVQGTTATVTITSSNDYHHPVDSVFALALTSHPGQLNGPAGIYERVSPSPSS